MTKKHWLCIKLVSLAGVVVFGLWLLTTFFFQHLISTTQSKPATHINKETEAVVFEPVLPGQGVSVATSTVPQPSLTFTLPQPSLTSTLHQPSLHTTSTITHSDRLGDGVSDG